MNADSLGLACAQSRDVVREDLGAPGRRSALNLLGNIHVVHAANVSCDIHRANEGEPEQRSGEEQETRGYPGERADVHGQDLIELQDPGKQRHRSALGPFHDWGCTP
jgi:hypothetical protein